MHATCAPPPRCQHTTNQMQERPTQLTWNPSHPNPARQVDKSRLSRAQHYAALATEWPLNDGLTGAQKHYQTPDTAVLQRSKPPNNVPASSSALRTASDNSTLCTALEQDAFQRTTAKPASTACAGALQCAAGNESVRPSLAWQQICLRQHRTVQYCQYWVLDAQSVLRTALQGAGTCRSSQTQHNQV